jgi:hypothetical protein
MATDNQRNAKMNIIQFPSQLETSPFFKGILEEWCHIFSLDHPGVMVRIPPGAPINKKGLREVAPQPFFVGLAKSRENDVPCFVTY